MKRHQVKGSLCFLDLPCHRARVEVHNTMRQWHRTGFVRETYKPEIIKRRESLGPPTPSALREMLDQALVLSTGFQRTPGFSPLTGQEWEQLCRWRHQILRAPGRLSAGPGGYCIVWGSYRKREEARTRVGSRLLQPPPSTMGRTREHFWLAHCPGYTDCELHGRWHLALFILPEDSWRLRRRKVWCTHPREIHTCEMTSVVT